MARKTVSKKIKNTVSRYVRQLREDGLAIDHVYLFGSYAKGKQHKWSDIDICIISPSLKYKSDPLGYLWSQRSIIDSKALLAPVGFTPADFVDEDPMAYEIKRTGIRIQ